MLAPLQSPGTVLRISPLHRPSRAPALVYESYDRTDIDGKTHVDCVHAWEWESGRGCRSRRYLSSPPTTRLPPSVFAFSRALLATSRIDSQSGVRPGVPVTMPQLMVR